MKIQGLVLTNHSTDAFFWKIISRPDDSYFKAYDLRMKEDFKTRTRQSNTAQITTSPPTESKPKCSFNSIHWPSPVSQWSDNQARHLVWAVVGHSCVPEEINRVPLEQANRMRQGGKQHWRFRLMRIERKRYWAGLTPDATRWKRHSGFGNAGYWLVVSTAETGTVLLSEQ